MRRRRAALAIAVVLVGVAARGGATPPTAAEPRGSAHGHGGHPATEAHRAVEACQQEFETVVRDGRGFGMAFAADRHGYPGPLHMLELAARLRLTPEQEAQARQMLHAMFAASRPAGSRLLEAEARLQRLFESGAATEKAVRSAVAEVERARREVRLVHLLTHLRARDLLTEEQRRIYREARWGSR